MQVDIHDTAGAVVGQAGLDDSVWAIEPNIAVMHQALLRQLANARLGTHDTQTRGEVRGGGKKPYRQKGTGRARQGSTRAPQFKGGGVVWGPHPRKYTQSLPRKMRLLAVRSALSAKVLDGRVVVLRGLSGVEPKTKAMKAVRAALPATRSTLIVVPSKEGMESVYRSASNLEDVRVIIASLLNVRDVLKYEQLLVLEEALPVIDGWLALGDANRTPGTFRQARLERLAYRQKFVLARITGAGGVTGAAAGGLSATAVAAEAQ
jgi:large subunit ribosomal protein L4